MIQMDCEAVNKIIHQNRDFGDFLKKSLIPRLQSLGYTSFIASFEGKCWKTERWNGALAACPQLLQVTVKFLLLGQSVDNELINKALGSAQVEAILNICSIPFTDRKEQKVGINDYRLNIVYGIPIFCQHSHDPSVYFGDDSLGLSSRLKNVGLSLGPDTEILDICAGSGIQGIVLMQGGSKGTFIEANQKAIGVLSANIAMNGMSSRAQIEFGLGENVIAKNKTKTWDYACWNPPLLPLPEDSDFQFVGDGGVDGLNITRGIISALNGLERIKQGFQFIGTTIVSVKSNKYEVVNKILEKVQIQNIGIKIWITAKRALGPNSPMLIQMLQTAQMKWISDGVTPLDAMAKAGPIMEMYGESSNELIFFIVEGLREKAGNVEVIDLSSMDNIDSYWFV